MDTIRLVSWNVNGFRALSGKPDWDWFASTDAIIVSVIMKLVGMVLGIAV